MQLQRKMRDRTWKESGGHPKKVGMRTRDRDRSETHTSKAASKGCRDASESRSDSLFSLVQTAPPAPQGFSHHWKLVTARQSVAWAICPCQAETLLQAALTVDSVRAGDKSPFPSMRSEMKGPEHTWIPKSENESLNHHVDVGSRQSSQSANKVRGQLDKKKLEPKEICLENSCFPQQVLLREL